jgi:hypothetical protein
MNTNQERPGTSDFVKVARAIASGELRLPARRNVRFEDLQRFKGGFYLMQYEEDGLAFEQRARITDVSRGESHRFLGDTFVLHLENLEIRDVATRVQLYTGQSEGMVSDWSPLRLQGKANITSSYRIAEDGETRLELSAPTLGEWIVLTVGS